MSQKPSLRENSDHLVPQNPEANSKAEAGLDLGKSAALDVVGADLDSAESLVMGNVSENASGVKESSGDAGGKSGGDSSIIEERRIAALSKIPADKNIIIKQIEAEINKEIVVLHDRLVKLTRGNVVDFSEASNLMRKIRELKGVLDSLLKVSYEKLKDVWLTFVHKIT